MDRTTNSRPGAADGPTPADHLTRDRVPLIPETLLHQHACFVAGDTRFRAASRLRQSLLRQDLNLEPGLHRPGGTSSLPNTPLGSMLTPVDAARGFNFLSPAVHAFVHRSLALREEGACVNIDRLFRNMLSSEPLVRNAFVPLALDLGLATRVFARLLPDFVHQVEDIRFETAPSRDRTDPRYLTDGTAFDAALSVITPDGEPATLFIEMKYTEVPGPAARHRSRYDEASRQVALHRDPDAPALRSVMLEQFWRLHLLADLSVRHGQTPRAHLLVLAPHLNRHVRTATRLYAAELLPPEAGRTGFSALTLETFVAALREAGAQSQATYFHHRYLDLSTVLDLVLGGTAAAEAATAPVKPFPVLPSSVTDPNAPASKSAPSNRAAPLRRRKAANPSVSPSLPKPRRRKRTEAAAPTVEASPSKAKRRER
ncbi:hypothetical protein [Methylobacterium sp. Leaf469]|uniref:PGN_0703 family putative restriction endonuclease n=1 Tax=Methylobacterium sp. Leaf469 TaxID=1736387 RepID=UPI000AB76437|nr:hypothetical protein [Methylobacterium sp. Leaf469]